MKTIFSIVFTVLSLVAIILLLQVKSYGDNEETENLGKTTKVSVTAKVEKDDLFQVFYLLEGHKDLNEDYTIRLDVKGGQQWQTLEFVIPDTLKIEQFRVDMGNNREQGPIQLSNITIASQNKKVSFNGKDIFKFFTPNQCIVLHPDSTSFTTQEIEGNYDPFFMPVGNLLHDPAAADYLIKNSENVAEKALTYVLGLLALGVLGWLIFMYRMAFLPIAFSAVFILFILVPLAKMAFWPEQGAGSLEKRELAQKPEFNWNELDKYPAKYEAYLNDNFGFRTLFVNWGSQLKSRFFKSSITPDKVAHGKDNWLFLSGTFDRILDDYSRKNLYSPEVLVALVNVWEQQKKVLEEQNIKYFKAFYPNKHTIYPEKLPYFIRIQQNDTISRADQIINYIQATKSGIKFIDVREDLQKAKPEAQLYFKHDTHWNEYGAFIAYQKLLTVMGQDFPELKPKPLSDFRVDWVPFTGGDLTGLLGAQDIQEYKDKWPTFYYKDSLQIEEIISDGEPSRRDFNNPSLNGGLTILVFHDSFTYSLMKFLSPHFKKSVFVASVYDQKIIDEVKPDIVLEGYVERYLK